MLKQHFLHLLNVDCFESYLSGVEILNGESAASEKAKWYLRTQKKMQIGIGRPWD